MDNATRTCFFCGKPLGILIPIRSGEMVFCARCTCNLPFGFPPADSPAPSPGLAPPRPVWGVSSADAEAQVDRMAQRINELEHETADMVMIAHMQGYERAKDRITALEAALDLETKARGAMAEGLAEAKDDRDRLMATFNLLLPILEEGADSGMVPRGDTIRALAHVKDLLIGQHPGPDPAIPGEDLVEALDDDPEPHRGWDEGHDTPEERNGER